MSSPVTQPDGRFDTVTADLSTSDGTGAVVERLALGGVDLLVNNAGAGYHGRFVDEPSDRIAAEVALDCVAVALLTRAAPFDSGSGGGRHAGRTPARQGSGGAGPFEQGVVAGLQVPTAKCDRPRIRMGCESPMRHVPSAGHFDRGRQPDVK
jgi:NAD(P)-dependent dehydrogenase (short-subunit alcohol dehydrogenase family)